MIKPYGFPTAAVYITKTCLYNFDPLKPHFYIVKLGFTGVYIIFLMSAQNIDCGYSLEPPRRGGSNMKKSDFFYLTIFSFLVVKFSVYLNRHVFVMRFLISKAVPQLQFLLSLCVGVGSLYANRIFMFFCIITKTRLCSFDPLKPHFYIVKLGFTRVYIISLTFARKHRLLVLVRTASPRRF